MTLLALDGSHTLSLRDYQREAIEAVGEAEARGIRRQLIVLPVGAGKTCVFTALAAERNVRSLILAHRDELITQAVDKARLWWPGADIGVVKAERNETRAQDLIVASIQSLSPARIAKLGSFGLVVADEAHHCRAPHWAGVLNGLGCGPDPQSRHADSPLLLGVTATPDRADGKGLDEIFDEIVYAKDLLWGIRAGYLSDIRAKDIRLADLDLSKVRIRQGDYAEGELGAALSAADAPSHIVKAWKEHASDRLTLVFTPTVANAVEVAAEFSSQGIQAAWVSGAEPMESRRWKMGEFAAGRVQVLVNVGIATEGYDNPAISCVVMARPTKSRGLFVQCLGRGCRLYPGKSDLLVLDVVGAAEGKDLCTVPSLFGMTKRQMGDKPAAKAISDIEAARDAEIAKATEPDPLLVSRDIELFKQVQAQGKVSWSRIKGESFACGAGNLSVVLDRKGPDRYSVVVFTREAQASVLMEGVPLALAQGIAEDHIRRNVTSVALIDKEAKWRGRAPSVRQLEAARKWGIVVPDGLTAGEVSGLINARVAEARRRRAGR